MKKRSPKEIIEQEASKNGDVEYAFVKFPGKELIPVIKKSNENEGEMNEEKIKELEKVYGEKRNRLHTHPYNPDTTMQIKGKEKTITNRRVSPDIPIPSDQDLSGFLYDSKAKSAYIAQYNAKTKKVEGYFVLRKTSRTPVSPGVSHLAKYAEDKGNIFKMVYHLGKAAFSILGTHKRINKYGKEISHGVIEDDPEAVVGALDKIAHKYKLRYRFVPAKGYRKSKHGTHFSKESNEEGGLEGKVVEIIAILGFGLGIYFLSTNITGNAIVDLPTNTTSWVGGVLLVVGLVAGFFWLRSKKK